jgi:hypothetical protein
LHPCFDAGITIDTDVAANVVKNLKPGGAPGSKPPVEVKLGKAGPDARSKPTSEAGEAEGVVSGGSRSGAGGSSAPAPVEDGYDEVVAPSAARDEL